MEGAWSENTLSLFLSLSLFEMGFPGVCFGAENSASAKRMNQDGAKPELTGPSGFSASVVNWEAF